MEEALLYIKEVGKRSSKRKEKKTFPTIQREDIMKYILSNDISDIERYKLSSMYYDIVKMETQNLQYVTEIAISSQNDSEIYDLINKLKNRDKIKNQAFN